jgi:hypothetical protein
MTNKMRQIHNILLLEMLYMFWANTAHHQELGIVCAAVQLLMMGNDGPKHVEHF